MADTARNNLLNPKQESLKEFFEKNKT